MVWTSRTSGANHAVVRKSAFVTRKQVGEIMEMVTAIARVVGNEGMVRTMLSEAAEAWKTTVANHQERMRRTVSRSTSPFRALDV